MASLHRALDALTRQAFNIAERNPDATVKAVEVSPHDDEADNLLVIVELTTGDMLTGTVRHVGELSADDRESAENVVSVSVALACSFGRAASEIKDLAA